jgi:hypothetical protein
MNFQIVVSHSERGGGWWKVGGGGWWRLISNDDGSAYACNVRHKQTLCENILPQLAVLM